jgi:hypothetical protein
MRKLRELLIDIHNRNFAPDRSNQIDSILSDYGIGPDNSPDWLVKALSLAADGKCGEGAFDADSNSGSLLLELQEQCGWDITYPGEYAVVIFPINAMRIDISHEAWDSIGKHGSRFKVSPVSHTA